MITGADGQKRAATIRVSNKGRTSTLDRLIQHLYPMEIVAHTNAVSERDTEESDGAAENEPIPDLLEPRTSRPRRSAAAQVRDHILSQAISGWDELDYYHCYIACSSC